MDHLLSIDQFDRNAIEQLFDSARKMKQLVEDKGGNDVLSHRVSANLFYEPSTRTSSSFTAAMYRLGGDVISINDVQYSSVAKGETLEDTIRTLEQYADVIVLRHPEVGAAKRASAVSNIPIINAGDGVGEHPTQALLDLFTIFEEHGHIDGLTISLVGDLKNGRTVHSLAKLLSLYDVSLQFVAPESLAFPEEHRKGLSAASYTNVAEVAPTTDVLYVTRVQKERFESLDAYEAVKNSYVIDQSIVDTMKPEAVVMHPLPRVGEIAYEVDSNPRAAYFRQMRNGLYIRMALLEALVNH